MKERGSLPASEKMDRYVVVAVDYLKFLEHYRGMKLVSRLMQHNKMMERVKRFHEDIDQLYKMLNLTSIGAMMDWRQQWEADRQMQVDLLTKMVRDTGTVVSELKNTQSQLEAMTNLMCERERHADRQSQQMLDMMQTMMATVARGSKTKIKPSLTPWYIPRADVEFEPVPFASGSFGSVHHGTWRAGTKVVVKCLLVEDSSFGATAQDKIIYEVSIWHNLNHPHVIKMFGASHVSSPPFMVREDAVHGNLFDYLSQPANHHLMWRAISSCPGSRVHSQRASGAW